MNTKVTLAFPADLHSGSTVGLMPSGVWQKEEGGTHIPSHTQELIYQQWIECWDVVRQLRKGGRLIVTCMGDLVDGIHHDKTELVTHIRAEQERMAKSVLATGLQIAEYEPDYGDIFQVLRGTPIHVYRSEEAIARDIDGARPHTKPSQPDGEDGRFVHSRLVFYVNGILFDCAHDGVGVGGRAWLEENQLFLTLKNLYWEALENGVSAPNYFIRAHKHQMLTVPFERRGKMIRGVITPAMQYKTEYGYSVTSKSIKRATIGMYIVVVEKDGSHRWHCPQFEMPEREIEEL